MQVFVGDISPEYRILLRSRCGIELSHYRSVDPVSALQHSAGMIGIVAPAKVRVPVRRTWRRSTGFQYVHLVKVPGYLYRRF